MEKHYQLEKIQQQWRNKLQFSYMIIAAIFAITELLVLLYRVFSGRISPERYLYEALRSFVIPMICVFITTSVVVIRNKLKISEESKNRAFVYGAMAYATITVCFHGYLYWTLCCFAIPVIVSVMFADKRLTYRTLFAGTILMFVSVVVCWYLDPNFELFEQMFVACINVSFLIIVYLICKQIVAFLTQKNEIIDDYGRDKESLKYALTLDAMTSLYNHAEFNRVLDKSRMECIENKSVMTLVMADIDHFKQVNDTYGHEQGDEVLITIANSFLHSCSNKGQAFRYGGEEFAGIFVNQTGTEVLEIMEEFRKCVSNMSYVFLPKGKRITISIGIYEYNGDESLSSHDIFSFVDNALYEAKNTGRNKCCISYEGLNEGKTS